MESTDVSRIKLLSVLFFFCSSCIPSFAPKTEIIKELHDGEVNFLLIQSVGVMDQRFPAYVLAETNEQSDTLCKAYNIADVHLEGMNLIIGFFGKPEFVEGQHMNDHFRHYIIKPDTSFRIK